MRGVYQNFLHLSIYLVGVHIHIFKILNNGVADKIIPEDYGSVLETIVSKIKAAQARAISAVNFELVAVYRDIG